MHTALLTVLMLMIAPIGQSYAQFGYFEKGGRLFEICSESSDLGYQIGCDGYVVGVFDGLMEGSAATAVILRRANPGISWEAARLDALGYCLPEAFDTQQLVAVVVDFLEENPQRWHENAAWLVRSALAEAFPCPN